MQYLPHLFENNRTWVEKVTARDPDFFRRLAAVQSPKYLWIGCSDSRVPARREAEGSVRFGGKQRGCGIRVLQRAAGTALSVPRHVLDRALPHGRHESGRVCVSTDKPPHKGRFAQGAARAISRASSSTAIA